MLENNENTTFAWSILKSIPKWKREAEEELIQYRENQPSKFAEIKILAEKLKEVIEQDGICDEALELYDQIFDLWSGGFFTDTSLLASDFYNGFYSPTEKLTKEETACLRTVRTKNKHYRERFGTELEDDYKNLMQKIFCSFDNHPELQINFIRKVFTKEIIFQDFSDENPRAYPSVFMQFLEKHMMDTDDEDEDYYDIYKWNSHFHYNVGYEEKFYILRDLCNVLNIKLDFDSIDIAAAKKYEKMYTDGGVTKIELCSDNNLYERAKNNNDLYSELISIAEEKIEECFATPHINDEQIMKVYGIAKKTFLREKICIIHSEFYFSFWKDFFAALPMTVRHEVFGAR